MTVESFKAKFIEYIHIKGGGKLVYRLHKKQEINDRVPIVFLSFIFKVIL